VQEWFFRSIAPSRALMRCTFSEVYLKDGVIPRSKGEIRRRGRGDGSWTSPSFRYRVGWRPPTRGQFRRRPRTATERQVIMFWSTATEPASERHQEDVPVHPPKKLSCSTSSAPWHAHACAMLAAAHHRLSSAFMSASTCDMALRAESRSSVVIAGETAS